ncbi:hypothetical protein [Hahella sp. HN01]|uniref:hypothetical protein n=1 Tax=unclassified Hahella TaxID=2624107 RepID=UPI001C1E96DE|nr:hypothetical protein [Hahella sp. HN01]MBU6950869.1 hypothetical protein [Hahella sp. HN01]
MESLLSFINNSVLWLVYIVLDLPGEISARNAAERHQRNLSALEATLKEGGQASSTIISDGERMQAVLYYDGEFRATLKGEEKESTTMGFQTIDALDEYLTNSTPFRARDFIA